jgi:hypothetical protein
MDPGPAVTIPPAAYHAIPYVLGTILTGIALRYRYTWWGSLALREFGLKPREDERESAFLRRRGLVWLWTTALLILCVYVIGQRWSEQTPDAPLWEFLVMFFGVVFAFWSLRISIRAFLASRDASMREAGESMPPNNRWRGP